MKRVQRELHISTSIFVCVGGAGGWMSEVELAMKRLGRGGQGQDFTKNKLPAIGLLMGGSVMFKVFCREEEVHVFLIHKVGG